MSPVGLVDLVPEILDLIIGQLCSHCQYGKIKILPEYNTVNDTENQAALAALCLTNSSIRNAAQPILHHFFVLNATTKLKRKKALQERLGNFIRTIANRPDLGQSVRVLTLKPEDGTYSSWKTPITADTWKSLPDYEYFAAKPEINKLITLRHVNGRPVNFGVASAVLLSLVPDLEYLLLQIDSNNARGTLQLPKALAKLRVLQLLPIYGSMLVGHKIAGVFRLFPEIQVFSAFDATMSCEHQFDSHSNQPKLCDHRLWEILPNTLRKLTFATVNIKMLARAFDHCPVLEDLDLLLYINSNWEWELVPPPNGAFENLRRQLRRLLISSSSSQSIPKGKYLETVTAPDGLIARARLTLRALGVLEILEIDQILLHAELRRHMDYSTHELSAVLPESLQALHVGYVAAWDVLQAQLQDLITAKSAGSFKALSTIQIDMSPNATDHPTEHQIAILTAAFEKHDVCFFVGPSPPSIGRRMLVPDAPGTPGALHHRPEFTLHDTHHKIAQGSRKCK